ncbi:uncharacterized protein LOC141604845 [Silene latifolia]|uniref:uncharacterized protein LOC141604845 n=1 Tax=Silene latifolia TaxID=37657 RepID=UPI003D77640E
MYDDYAAQNSRCTVKQRLHFQSELVFNARRMYDDCEAENLPCTTKYLRGFERLLRKNQTEIYWGRPLMTSTDGTSPLWSVCCERTEIITAAGGKLSWWSVRCEIITPKSEARFAVKCSSLAS